MSQNLLKFLKKSVDIFSLKEKYNIYLLRSYKKQTSAPQIVHFSEKLESTIPETVDELKTGDSGIKLEIIPSKRSKGQKLKSKKIVKTNKEKKMFSNDSEEEDTESDDEKNEKGTKNEIKTIIKTIDFEFSLNYNQIFTSVNNYEICHKLISELQKSLALKFRPSVTHIYKSRRAIARMRNSGKLLKDLCRVYANNWQNDKKICRIKVAKELFRKNDPNIINYDKESLLRMLTDCTFYLPEMSNIDEENNSKTVVNVYDLFWRFAEVNIYF
ncbi:hypothetical protein Glove_188g9 [Diversispora epigaea]|uniref:Uncharacterized protein n=1 Tax=Diversispora epigaea TaxID=1348612 RepID=A0A397IV89_9GLOM|nr:hypothetical protein Glove_188g9 [Diversispora epigaea]